MPQPTYENLFGTGAIWDATGLHIPQAALASTGLSANPPSALELYAAIVKQVHGWLSTNTDQAVLASSDLTVQAPLIRNGIPRTQYQFSERFFGSYNAPEFDPDQV